VTGFIVVLFVVYASFYKSDLTTMFLVVAVNYNENGTIVLATKGCNFVSVLHVFRFIHAAGLVYSINTSVGLLK
jgi:hypothetical protein